MAPPRKSVDASDSEEEGEHLQYKIIILGDGAVGKTATAQRFTEDRFFKSYKQTIGLDFFSRRIALPDGINVSLQVWDIGGQTIGGKMIGNYIYGSQAVILLYDITNFQSFQDLEDWYQLVQRTFEQDTLPYVALVGNKVDLAHLRTVRPEIHNKFAEENNMYSYFISAKTGDNVHACFYRVAADLAGVQVSKADIDGQLRVVPAEVVRHDLKNSSETSNDRAETGKKCVVM